jgi:prolipoprotein diacylglyceryl transferase
MTILNYILWSGSPEIFSISTFSLRWYGLLFALGFLISQQILYYIYRKENKPEQDVDTITIYMVIATILGARLGHVIFYQPELFWKDPASILLPFELNPFRFTGLQGLASHGGTIGILFALWLYSRKRKPGQNYLQVLDRIVILCALTGALIRLGNYFNAEIIGKPTDKPWGVVFAGSLTGSLESPNGDPENIIESVTYHKNDTSTLVSSEVGREPISIYIFFKKGVDQMKAETYIEGRLHSIISNNLYEYFDDRAAMLDYQVVPQDDGSFAARIRTTGISRHPAQLYESISCIILFFLLFMIWNHYKENLPQGRLFAIFLIVCFGLRFLFEFLKENQEDFENSLPINMGQILSIPLILAGFVMLYISYTKNKSVQSPEN